MVRQRHRQSHPPPHASIESLEARTLLSAISQLVDFPAREYRVGTNPRSVTMADFNRDGHLDLAVVSDGFWKIAVQLNKGDGTFGDAALYPCVSNNGNPQDAQAADFN